MPVQIISGKQASPVKGVIYGPEGVGKSSLAKAMPKPIFIDVEGGTHRLDVSRTQRPQSWGELLFVVSDFAKDRQGFETLVIDTADWAEQLAVKAICERLGYNGLGGNGDYGQSFNELAKMWSDLLTMLETDFIQRNWMHVVFLAHSQTRKFELPEEQGQFDRYQLKMEKKTAPMLKEWAELLLFCNYKTFVTTDDKGKNAKALGGTQRILCTSHCAAWDAKNRHDLPAELPLEFSAIAHCFQPLASAPATAPVTAPAPVVAPAVASAAPSEHANVKSLRQMMQVAGVNWEQVLEAIIQRCEERSKPLFYPRGTPLENVEPKFIQEILFPNWTKITESISNLIPK